MTQYKILTPIGGATRCGRGREVMSFSDEVGETLFSTSVYPYVYSGTLLIWVVGWLVGWVMVMVVMVRGSQALLGQRGGHLVREGGQLRRVGHV